MPICIATWNVNSIRTRLPHLLAWLKEDAPDIVLLQELKCTDEQFPAMEIEDMGYNIATHGQKTYNGVAILSKFPLEDVTRGLPTFLEDVNARYIEAIISLPSSAIRVASVYIPNGQSADSDKFQYKLQFLERLSTHLKTLLTFDESVVIGGDYNIAPTDADVAQPRAWAGSVLTHDAVRKAWRMICNSGWSDAALIPNTHSPIANAYTWWDYRAGAFEKDDGLRIDHLLLSPQATDQYQNLEVKKSLRAFEKPSDHAPVIVTLKPKTTSL